MAIMTGLSRRRFLKGAMTAAAVSGARRVLPSPAPAGLPSGREKLFQFRYSDVKLTGGPLKHAQEITAKYLLSLEPDRMMAFYRVRAGLPQKHGFPEPAAGRADGDVDIVVVVFGRHAAAGAARRHALLFDADHQVVELVDQDGLDSPLVIRHHSPHGALGRIVARACPAREAARRASAWPVLTSAVVDDAPPRG